MSTATAAFVQGAETRDGLLHELFGLAVSHPVAHTWYLARYDLAPDALWAGSPAYWGLVLEHGGLSAEAALGGTGGAGTSLTLYDGPGSYPDAPTGPWKRFSDLFAEPIPAYGVPYDLRSARLTVSLAWDGLTSADALVVASYVLDPRQIVLVQDVMIQRPHVPVPLPELPEPPPYTGPLRLPPRPIPPGGPLPGRPPGGGARPGGGGGAGGGRGGGQSGGGLPSPIRPGPGQR